MDIESVIGDYKIFLDNIFQNLKDAGFDLDEFKELDHIAYRTESLEAYEKIKEKLIPFSESYSDKIFAGRPVLICRLKTPLVYEKFEIAGIEVLAPKENNKFKEGLEHVEFVTKTTLPEFLEKYKDTNFGLESYDRKENPEIKLKFKDCAVKFHTQSILEVRGL